MSLANKPQQSADVLSYFLRNPQAADNLEGVARWRLLDEVVHQHVEQTRAALDWLVARGVLRRIERSGVEPVYSLEPSHIEQAERLLAELMAAGGRSSGR